MPLLTRKFTRDSLRGASDMRQGDEPSEICARARARSLRSRPRIHLHRDHQINHRRHNLSEGTISPFRFFELENFTSKLDVTEAGEIDQTLYAGPAVPTLSHPSDDELGRAYNDAEIINQMSSLTEPTWAGAEILTHRRHGRSQNQIIYKNRFQNRLQHFHSRKDKNRASAIAMVEESFNKEAQISGEDKNDDSIEVQVNDGHRDDGVEEDQQKNDSILDENVSEKLTVVPFDQTSPTASSIASSNKRSIRRSQNLRGGAERNYSSSRSRGSRTTLTINRSITKRSSSLSSHNTFSSRLPVRGQTLSKGSSILSLENSKRKEQNISLSTSSSNGRSQRSLSLPHPSVDGKSMNSNNAKSSCSREILDTGTFGFYDNSDENTKCSTTSRAAKFIAIHSSMQEHETIPVSKTRLTLATTSDTHDEWTEDCPPTPPSTAEVARMSLRGALRRSTSSRSITSTRSESIGSTSSHRAKLIISRSKSLVRCQQSPSLVVTNPSTSPRVGISARQFSSSILPRNVSYKNRINKLAEDARVRKIQQQKAQEEIKKRQRQYLQDEEKEAIADKAPMFTFMSSNYMVKNNIEPKTTSLGTLVCDLLLFHLLTLLTLPRYAIIGLWRFLFSKNWTARYKHVLITGASSPLGTETARQFATEGANLILIAHSGILDKDDLDLLASQCHELGSTKVRCYCADLSSTVSAELCFRQIAKDFDDTIDVVVLNGENMSHGCCFEEILDSTHIEKMIKDNTLCSMIALHFALKYIPKKSESRIVMLSSTSGLVSLPYKSVHAASHHALRGFCDSVRMELNDTYDHRAPKVCLASFPDLICQHTFQRKKVDHIVSYMGSENVPMKTRPWAGIPLQHAVNDLLQAVAAGKRDFGSPNYVRVWNCLRILFPDWIYFSVFRHIRKTQYRPIGNNSSKL